MKTITEQGRDLKIMELRQSGKTLAEIGKIYGLTREGVRLICDKSPKKKEKIEVDRAIEVLKRYKDTI